jgi:hypothetical protein
MKGIKIKKTYENEITQNTIFFLAIQPMSYSVRRLFNLVHTLSSSRPKKGLSFTPIEGVLQ